MTTATARCLEHPPLLGRASPNVGREYESSTSGTRILEELWLLRLKNAELRYTHTREQLRNVLRTLPPGEVPPADGSYAYQHAILAENIALAEYTRVLRIFTDLVVDGKTPRRASRSL